MDELRRELKARGLTTGGLKKYLKERLEKYMVDKVSVASSISEESAPPIVFGVVARWKTLTTLEEPVFDSTVSTEYHALTVGSEEVSVVKKRNFRETFDRPPFIGTYKVDILDRFKKRKIDPKTKKLCSRQCH